MSRPGRRTGATGSISNEMEDSVLPRMSARLFANLLLVLSGSPLASGSEKLSLEDCVRLAMTAPSTASVARQEVAAASAGITAARAALLPQARFAAGSIYNSPLLWDRSQFSFVALNGLREYLGYLEIRYDLDLSGRIRANLALARAQRLLAEASRRLAERDLRRAVAGAYYDLLLARHMVEQERSGLAQAEDFERRVQALARSGEASLADVHKAAALRARFQQRLSQAELNAQLANQALASFWTDRVNEELDIVDSLENPPEPPGEILEPVREVADVVNRRPELTRLAALEQQYLAEARIARAGLRPQASAVVQYGLDANRVWAQDRGYALFVNLEIPVFDWFAARSQARQAEYRRTQVLQQAAISRREFAREYWAAAARVRSWWERSRYARQELEHNREDLRLARLRFESGEGSALEVVTAQTQTVDSAEAYDSALAEYLKAIVDFEVASGK